MSAILLDILSNDQLSELKLRLKRSDDPVARALMAELNYEPTAAPAAPKPATGGAGAKPPTAASHVPTGVKGAVAGRSLKTAKVISDEGSEPAYVPPAAKGSKSFVAPEKQKCTDKCATLYDALTDGELVYRRRADGKIDCARVYLWARDKHLEFRWIVSKGAKPESWETPGGFSTAMLRLSRTEGAGFGGTAKASEDGYARLTVERDGRKVALKTLL